MPTPPAGPADRDNSSGLTPASGTDARPARPHQPPQPRPQQIRRPLRLRLNHHPCRNNNRDEIAASSGRRNCSKSSPRPNPSSTCRNERPNPDCPAATRCARRTAVASRGSGDNDDCAPPDQHHRRQHPQQCDIQLNHTARPSRVDQHHAAGDNSPDDRHDSWPAPHAACNSSRNRTSAETARSRIGSPTG